MSSTKQAMMDNKLIKFKKLIYQDEVTDLNELRSMAWAGVPPAVRHVTWKLLLGYLPVVREKRAAALARKRSDYQHYVEQYYNNNRCPDDEIWRQIHIDIPRMQPLVSIFQQEIVQRIFQRILYIYSIRHPASGYVQGMNDLVIPFFVVYLSEFMPTHSLSELDHVNVSTLSEEVLQGVEADSFWSLNKLLDSIQDNYTFAQPGIQSLVHLLSRVMSRIDSKLHNHLSSNNVNYLLFSFRWMNNLLIRELPLRCIIRLWDTYLAEGALTSSTANVSSSSTGSTLTSSLLESSNLTSTITNNSLGNGSPFAASFHLYVCAAFLRYWSKNLLQENDFQGLILYLQNLPTFHWGDNEVELLVADAYSLKETFTPNHLLSS